MVIGIDSMGSICSSSKNNNNNATLPPKDLGELLEQAEKVDRGSGKVGMGESWTWIRKSYNSDKISHQSDTFYTQNR